MKQSINVVVARKKGPHVALQAPVPMSELSVFPKLAELTDVDTLGQTSGSVPVYNAETVRYDVRDLEFEELADSEAVDGGSF